MKKLIMAITILFLSGNSIFGQNLDKKGFALLELYTSEGCSSCPPADELMGRIQNEYKDSNVYVLSYHVDYWDKQGWKDAFSSQLYTARQYEYAQFLGKEPIYTPQLIINGKNDFVGSQETVIRNGIKAALSKPASISLSLSASYTVNKLALRYNVEGNSKNSSLVIAVVQKSAKSNVKRGENAHRILLHYQIVQQLHKIDLNKDSKGNTVLVPPRNFNPQDFEVIGFVQNQKNGHILDVSKVIF
ncbi:DUF1223 domain-containing protein [Flavobacterium reichenbachii]|nr:DUF1223 domain-containing protein [Flavobacterium reichenbachii]